ncbi:hypothetical protein CVT24_003979 [Panaeolus cyanescens]|uniref:MHD domain-containing protein n=1 Tax=Panaeolus cyanescens TaxID=181874 RepID=A0A409WYR3_9AGAR|nr:hypothetical protein CVT24_003979 [Panaeolus cyanescens]
MSTCSINSTSSLTAAVLIYDPQPIPAAAAEVMRILSPLISSSSDLDRDIDQWLKGFRERFVKAVRYMCITIKHTLLGLTLLCSILSISNTKPNSLSRANQLRRIAEDLLAGNACATDGLEQYRALRTDIESQFNDLAQKFGEESVIDVSGNSHTTRTTLKTLRTVIALRLEESEKASFATVDILTGMNSLLRSFLEDEGFSLTNPLTTAPLFSLDMFRTWGELRERFISFEVELRRPMLAFNMGFILDADESIHELEEDKRARKHQIPEIQIKLQGIPERSSVSDASSLSHPPPRQTLISVNIPKTSGPCVICVERCDNPQPGTTGVRAIFTIPVPDTGSRLKSISLHAALKSGSSDSDSPSFALKNKSSTVEQIVRDPEFEPPNCKPIFTTSQPSKSTLQWTFLRQFRWRIWKSTPILPTQLAVSFDIEHSTPVKLQLNVVFRFRQRLFGITSDIVNGQLPVTPNLTPAEIPLQTTTSSADSAGAAEPGPTDIMDRRISVGG